MSGGGGVVLPSQLLCFLFDISFATFVPRPRQQTKTFSQALKGCLKVRSLDCSRRHIDTHMHTCMHTQSYTHALVTYTYTDTHARAHAHSHAHAHCHTHTVARADVHDCEPRLTYDRLTKIRARSCLQTRTATSRARSRGCMVR